MQKKIALPFLLVAFLAACDDEDHKYEDHPKVQADSDGQASMDAGALPPKVHILIQCNGAREPTVNANLPPEVDKDSFVVSFTRGERLDCTKDGKNGHQQVWKVSARAKTGSVLDNKANWKNNPIGSGEVTCNCVVDKNPCSAYVNPHGGAGVCR